MSNDNMKSLRALLTRVNGKELTEGMLQEGLGIGFKEASYIIDNLAKQGILVNGIVRASRDSIDKLAIKDDSLIKHINLIDDACAIIKRDGKYDQHAIEEELNVSSNLLFDLAGELLNRGIIERSGSDYKLKA